MITCDHCAGEGRIARSTSEATYPCERCDGTGVLEAEAVCRECGGALTLDVVSVPISGLVDTPWGPVRQTIRRQWEEQLVDQHGEYLCPAGDHTWPHVVDSGPPRYWSCCNVREGDPHLYPCDAAPEVDSADDVR